MSYGNVTIPALALAQPVPKPEIGEILDLDTGEYLGSCDFIRSHRYHALVEARGKIVERMKSDQAHYACAMCGVAVYLVATSEKRFFFRHRVEDGSCPAQTRSSLSMEEIYARKYHGLRESEPHIRIKALIEQSLAADPQFDDIAVERTWHALGDAKDYRRPDVQAMRANLKMAFEVQLSTTFLSVVVGRRMFYREQGAILMWVLGGFDPAYRRLTTDDLLFSNNSNVFVVDDETLARSIAEQAFYVRCHFRRPKRVGDIVTDEWSQAVVSFHELTLDQEGQRLFFFDHEAAERDLRDQIAGEALERAARVAAYAQRKIDELRHSFCAFWSEKGGYMEWNAENIERWEYLRNDFGEIALPQYPDGDREMRAMLNAILSVRAGAPIGWSFKTLTQLGHHLAATHPRQLLAFGYAVRLFDRTDQMRAEDVSGKWEAKSKRFALNLKAYDAAYMPEPRLLHLMSFLFPEVGSQVSAYMERAEKAGKSPYGHA